MKNLTRPFLWRLKCKSEYDKAELIFAMEFLSLQNFNIRIDEHNYCAEFS